MTIQHEERQDEFSQGRAQELWASVRARLRDEVGEKTFERCLMPLSLVEAKAERVVLAMTTRFMGDFVMTHFGDRLLRLWQGIQPTVISVEIVAASGKPVVATATPELRDAGQRNQPHAGSAGGFLPPVPPTGTSGGSGDGLDRGFSFENFVVGKSNQLAFAAAQRVAEGGAPSYNPLYVYGPSGLGKTHLMHAIGNKLIARDPSCRVRYITAESFLCQFVSAIRYKDTLAFKSAFRNVDVLMVDDVQFMDARKETTQEEFFHTFNALAENRRQIVISADCAPKDLEGIDDRIRSRFGCGMTVDIQQTDYELRLGILQLKADCLRQRQLVRGYGDTPVPVSVLEFLAERINTNVRDLEGALHRLFAHAELMSGTITVDTSRHLLKDLLRASERLITIEEIMQVVAEHAGLRVADLKSERRSAALVRARHMAMWLAKELTQKSYPVIAAKFGGRDHTTVIHAVRKVDTMRTQDPAFAAELDMLVRKIRG